MGNVDGRGAGGGCASVSLIRNYWFAGIVTMSIWAAVGFGLGASALFTVFILTALEVTFSFDNAVVNSELLKRLSRTWQTVFLTGGILISVFMVRLVVPIVIAKFVSGLSFTDTVNLALHHPDQYSAHLKNAVPITSSFGMTFLGLLALGFFLDEEKNRHWFAWIEERLSRLGRFDNIPLLFMAIVSIVVPITIDAPVSTRFGVAMAAFAALALQVGLDLFEAIFGEEATGVVKTLSGAAAAMTFVRLEVLDASFSFDGIIGAFAITSSIVLIMAGLGAGSLWIRSMTVHALRSVDMAKIRFLNHGAYAAIGALAVFMGLKQYGVDLPEYVTGSAGLVLIGWAVLSSKRADSRGGLPAATNPASLMHAYSEG